MFIFLLLCAWLTAPAQEDSSFRRLRSLKGDIVSFTVDNLDNLYVLNSRNQIRKYNVNGDSVAIFNDVRRYGKATLVDVSNPLKVLVYYRDFATVLMLDRFLNVVNTIDLRKQNIFQARAIGQSYDNKIWVYDELENKLKKIDEDGKLLQETADFRLLFDKSLSPVKLYDENKYLYVCDTLKGIYVFDYFGAIKNIIQITRWQNLKVTGKYIYGSRGDSLYRYEISRFVYDEWPLPAPLRSAKSFNFTGTRLYALRENEVEIYELR